MIEQLQYSHPYRHGFVRAAAAIPEVALADPKRNASRIIELASTAAHAGASIIVFPELSLTGYSCDDLFHQSALQREALRALATVAEETAALNSILMVGLPLLLDDALFNVAAVVSSGRVVGVVPKSYLPNYREYYEKRYFAHAPVARMEEIELLSDLVPFGTDLLFEAPAIPGFRIGIEICEDLWAPIPPSTYAALAGATVLCNLSASNVTVSKPQYRRLLCKAHSGRTASAYIYAGTGHGESTTDLAWDGQALICENADLIGESELFRHEGQIVVRDIDLDRLSCERLRLSSFQDSVERFEQAPDFRRLQLGITAPILPESDAALKRDVARFPYVPNDPAEYDERCEEAYQIQVHGLVKRLQATGIERIVIGVSGGLDSTHALVVGLRAMRRLGLPSSNVLAYTMPGFATSAHTLDNAHALMRATGVTAHEIDIKPSCLQMLKDLDHPFAEGKPLYDITFENVQAGERTSHLFRLANQQGALVLGTGDLSELALGWSTYGVGDQMSHYNVNGSVPKTLIQHLLRWLVAKDRLGATVSAVLQSIVDTEISPELIPADKCPDGASSGGPSQATEATIGPYELQDFHLYYTTRYGYAPSKVAYLAEQAWSDLARGHWPPGMGATDAVERNAYQRAEIKRWLAVFLDRFFRTSQFKRSALPNGPKVGSGGSLSPRGDWRAPSDSTARVWLDELERNVPDLPDDAEA